MYTSKSYNDYLSFSIPSRKNWVVIGIMSIWFVLWASGAALMIGALFALPIMAVIDSTLQPVVEWMLGYIFCLIFVAAWIIGGFLSARQFFWQWAGIEHIQFAEQSIMIRRTIFGYGRSQFFSANHIKHMRVTPFSLEDPHYWYFSWWSGFRRLWRIIPGPIAFEYGAHTIRFADALDEVEAKQVYKQIIARFPQYAQKL